MLREGTVVIQSQQDHSHRYPTVADVLHMVTALSLMPLVGGFDDGTSLLGVGVQYDKYDFILPFSTGLSGLSQLSIYAFLQVCVRRLGTWDLGFRRTIAAPSVYVFTFSYIG